jgi:nicotinamidase-related amidase
MIFTTDRTLLVLVDVQEKLTPLMHERDACVRALAQLLKGAAALRLPVIWMEQLPEKMGATIPELRELLTDATPISKGSFSCCGEPAFREAFRTSGCGQVLLAGIESHVCVYQTAADLLADGLQVKVIADAVSSRTPFNRQAGLDAARAAGAGIATVEMILFELMRDSTHPAFREILKIVR